MHGPPSGNDSLLLEDVGDELHADDARTALVPAERTLEPHRDVHVAEARDERRGDRGADEVLELGVRLRVHPVAEDDEVAIGLLVPVHLPRAVERHLEAVVDDDTGTRLRVARRREIREDHGTAALHRDLEPRAERERAAQAVNRHRGADAVAAEGVRDAVDDRDGRRVRCVFTVRPVVTGRSRLGYAEHDECEKIAQDSSPLPKIPGRGNFRRTPLPRSTIPPHLPAGNRKKLFKASIGL